MKIKLAKDSGFCFGVRRAIGLVEKVLAEAKCPVYCYGPLIHNPPEMERLAKKGLMVVDTLKEIKKGSIFIVRSHGLSPGILENIKKKGMKIVDATCPNVKRAQRICHFLSKEGYTVIIVGDPEHPEVKSLRSFASRQAIVLDGITQAKRLNLNQKTLLGILSQTTQTEEFFLQICTQMLEKNFSEIRIFNTVCSETILRQKAARELARKVGVICVVGGKKSANTKRLVSICKKSGARTYHIEKANQVKGICTGKSVGVIGGASTPHWLIEEVIEKLNRIESSKG